MIHSLIITFERMPGLISNVRIKFKFHYPKIHAVVTYPYPPRNFKNQINRSRGATVTCQNIESGMRLAVKKALSPCVPQHYIYRMFRRWMWLAKADYECNKHVECMECPYMDDEIHCHTNYAQFSIDAPKCRIFREFGKVIVEIE